MVPKKLQALLRQHATVRMPSMLPLFHSIQEANERRLVLSAAEDLGSEPLFSELGPF